MHSQHTHRFILANTVRVFSSLQMAAAAAAASSGDTKRVYKKPSKTKAKAASDAASQRKQKERQLNPNIAPVEAFDDLRDGGATQGNSGMICGLARWYADYLYEQKHPVPPRRVVSAASSSRVSVVVVP